MSGKIFSVLFLCDDGGVRAPIAAAMMNASRSEGLRAYSAGLTPGSAILPTTLDALRIAGVSVDGCQFRALSEFFGLEAPRLDFVFDLTEPYEGCDIPVFPGSPVLVPWPIPRPNLSGGSPAEQGARMTNTLRMIRRRVELFAELPLERLDSLAMRLQAESVHQQAGT